MRADETDLWIGICGPLTIVKGETARGGIPGRGERAVLGLLALHAGSPVLPGSIMAALWPEQDPPATASAIVHTYISRLRVLLGITRDHGRSLISRDSSGYRLNVASTQLDLLTFRECVGRARTAEDPGHALVIYEGALKQWRGDPLEDVEALRAHPAVTALVNHRIDVTLEWADLAMRAGQHENALPRLRDLAAAHPLDERVTAAFVSALAGSGRQAESLRIYDDLRRRLDHELGVTPGADVRRAHQRVLRQEIAQSRDGAAGPEIRQLPATPADFTGRQRELAALIGATSVPENALGIPIVVVSGQPGIGKTALALHAAHKLSPRFPDGQLWVQLAGASDQPRDPGDVLGIMLRSLGISGSAIPDETSGRSAALRSALARRKILVVADDAASAQQVAPLLPGTSGCAVIVTSRQQLQDLAAARHVMLDVFSREDSVELLTQLIGPERVSTEREAALALCEKCGGLPLAIRVAGGKLATRPSWPLEAMVRKLTRSQTRLTELEAGQLSVRASIASSYAALPSRHQLVFRRLALLGPNDYSAWVIRVLLEEEEEADDVLEDLVSSSLVGTVGADATGELRYRLHDLLRDFAAEELAGDPVQSTDAALGRLLRAWLQLAQLANDGLPPEPYFPQVARAGLRSIILPRSLAAALTADPIAWFTAERTNLRTAVEQASRASKTDIAWQIAACLGSYHHLQDRHDDAESLWRMVTAGSGDSIPGLWAELRVAASLNERGRVTEARPILTRCVQRAKQANDPELLAFSLYWLGICNADLDDEEEVIKNSEYALDAARTARSRLGELHSLRSLCTSLSRLGRHESGVAAGEQALAIATELGVDSYELAALHHLVIACNAVGRFDRARSLGARQLELSRRLGDVRGEGIAYAVLGDAYHGLAEYESAIGSFLKALPIFESHDAGRFTAVCLLRLGHAYEAMGRYAEAIMRLEQSRDIFRQLLLEQRSELAEQSLDRCRLALAAGG